MQKKWTPCAIRPTWKVKIGYQYVYLYVALNPFTGDLFALILPRLNAMMFQIFLDHFMEHYHCKYPERRDQVVLMIADQCPAHTAKKVEWPRNLQLEELPPYSPELNPAERFFEEMRKVLADEIFENLDEVEEALAAALRPYWANPQAVVQLALYPWMNPMSN